MKISIFLLVALVIQCFANESVPRYFRRGDFYPRKGERDYRRSEVKSSGAIRDIIRRNSPRFRKVLVRNTNNEIVYANEDCRLMTSRAKSKLDVLGSLVRTRMGQQLRVEKSWTDNVDRNDYSSLHYEGRAFKVRLQSGQTNRLSDLMKTAITAGFDWVYYEDDSFIHISVVPDVCQTKLDLAIVVDTSGSVGYNNFKKIQEFLKNLVDFFNIGQSETHIALISYSWSVRVEFRLTQHYSKYGLKDAINRMWYQGSSTRTGDALMTLKNDVFTTARGMRADKSIPKIGILMTDGKSNGGGRSVYDAAQQLKNVGINMFVIGVTNNVNRNEINAIASPPVNEHYFAINGFNDLSSFVDQISAKSCDEGAQINTCENAVTQVEGGSFKYFRVQLKPTVERVSVEVIDRSGKSFLYTSLVVQNPGPLSERDVLKNTQQQSPRTISVQLPRGRQNLLYIAVQGQEDNNQFELSIWDSLFPKDREVVTVKENQNPPINVKQVQTKPTGDRFRYSIKAGAQGHFRINQDNGQITTTARLDRENIAKYQLSIVAQDINEKCHKGLMVLEVEVGDENDHSPKFERSYVESVREDAPSSQWIVQVKATDKDAGLNAKIVYEISGPAQDRSVFRIERDTGIVRTNQKLDYETKRKYVLTLTAYDSGSPRKSGTTTLTINVQDVNEAPYFTGCGAAGSCSHQLKEEMDPGQRIMTMTAQDPDVIANCQLTFSITSMDRQYFQIGKTSGLITTKTKLDREVKEDYVLDVVVQDCDKNPLSAKTTVRVTALDINDNKPKFPYGSPLRLNVREDFAINKNIHQFRATDADKGINAEIEYFISSNKGSPQFVVNRNNGQLTLQTQLDREQQDTLEFEVTAKDKGTPSLEGQIRVIVTVDDVNDNTPKFQGTNQAQVAENVSPNTQVMTVLATDADAGFNAKIQYSITGGNTGSMFKIDANSGIIRTNNIPDRETLDTYNLRIRAKDLGRPSLEDTKTYTIRITDMNDNNPVFNPSSYTKEVAENTPTNTEVLKVQATDRDIDVNAQIEYFLEAGHNNDFKINKATGSIQVARPLQFGAKNYYRFRVRATDKGTPSLSGYATVTFNIKDTNDHKPKFERAVYTASINENVPRNTKLIQVKATDADSGPSGQLVYSIISQDRENHFYIDSNTGDIYTRGNIDYERKTSYTIQVKATDRGNPPQSGSATINVGVNDLNDNTPTFTSSFINVREGFALNTAITKIQGQDDDGSAPNNQFAFSMETKKMPFSISKDGTLTLNTPLDRETKDSYSFVVRITDKGTNPKSLTSTGTINVQVLDDNDNTPDFGKKSFTCSIPENSPKNTHVCYTRATDRDIGENARITYSITGGENKFSVDDSKGAIKAKVSLDREQKDTYTVEITARDNGTPSLSSKVTVTIQVKDVNDNKPLFKGAPYKLNVQEEQSDNIKIGEFEATDRDINENARLTFTIMSGHMFGNRRMFTMATENGKGVLRANQLDREVRDKYVLRIRVEDAGKPQLSSETTVTVTVQDINDNSPILSESTYRGKVKENVGRNTLVVKIQATDKDIGKNAEIAYTITGGQNQDHFNLNVDNGELRTAKGLDYETIKQYTFNVKAQDKGNPTRQGTATIIVDIENVDDNAPKFKDIKKLEVPEDIGINQPIVKVEATDQDQSTITYSISGGNQEDKFKIDSKTAVLSIKNSLDRETTDKYNISITAKDSARSSVTYVPITVLDVNDNTPIFGKNEYTLSVPEDASPVLFANPVLQKVTATDRDIGLNAEIEFFITSGNVGDKFQISKDSGELRATGKLDREQVDFYDLILTAKDKGTPSLKSSVHCKITVTDLNDNRPIFEQASYAVSINENTSPQTKILDIRATDLDINDNGKVGYSITSGDTKTFSIDPVSGELKTIKALDRETTDSYKLTVQAFDHGKPKLTTNVRVTVTILDINDNAPKIASFNVNPVNESEPIGYKVATITASDADLGVNAELVYSLAESQNQDFFRIDSKTGEVFLKKQLDRETQERHNVKFTVKDKGNPVLSSSVDKVIQVLDDNDNEPVFGKARYEASVREGSTKPIVLFTASATDRDFGINAEITYSLLDTFGGKFSINADTGLVRAVKPLDYETKKSYTLKINAADWKYKNVIVDGIITVINVNDNDPKLSAKSYSKTIPENTPTQSSVLVVKATDEDPFGELVFTIETADSKLPFSINSKTGEIYVSGYLDRETKDNYQFKVKVSDGGTPKRSVTADISITLSDINDNKPVFPEYKKSVNITENNNVGVAVHTIKATDADLGKNAAIRYRIKPGTEDSEFTIGETDGIIKTKKVFDRETQTKATLIVQAYDLGTPSLSSDDVIITVTILDENDNIPKWRGQFQVEIKVDIKEHTAVGTQIRTVIADDADEGENGRVSYSIKEDSSPVAINSDSGLITVSKDMDREKVDKHVVTLVARDNGIKKQLQSELILTINVLDINDNAPVVQPPKNGKVKENEPANTQVMRIIATDADIGINAQMRYTIENYLDLFTLNEDTGMLTTKKALDREEQERYILKVRVFDQGTPTLSGTANITIIIGDVDDNCPVFERQKYETTIEENAAFGTFVLTVKATDRDTGRNAELDYGILESNDRGAFKIDDISGNITVVGEVNKETESRYFLKLRAGAKNCGLKVNDSDVGEGGKPRPENYATTTVYINVIDVNDNAPTFLNGKQRIEYADVMRSDIITLNATDKDEGLGGQVEYSFVSQIQKQSPQNEVENHVTIMAKDKGKSQQLNSTLTLVVVNKVRCEAMQYFVDSMNGKVTVQNLCSVTNANAGETIALLGSSKTLKCSAESNIGSVKYRWMKDGTIVSDYQDAGVLLLKNMNFEMAGSYSCIARNSAGTLQSSPTDIVLHQPPSIITQPKSVTVGQDEKFILEVNARGVPSPSYQWHKNDVQYERATSNTFEFESAVSEDSAEYYCVVENVAGKVTTNKVKVQVFDKETVVKVTVRITKYDAVRKCYLFDSDDFEKLVSKATNERVVVTKVTGASANVTLCPVTVCTKNPCAHDGKCTELDNGAFQCQCKTEWTGKTCQEDIDECQNANMCNNGQCINRNGSFTCKCPSGYTGRRCEYKIDACKPTPCASDENCVPRETGKLYACLKKDDEMTLVVTDKDGTFTKDDKYLLEHLLNQLLKSGQGSTTFLRRKRRRRATQSIDVGDCTLHIIRNQQVNSTKTVLKLALDCPNSNITDTSALLKTLCARFLAAGGKNTVIEQCGREGEMEEKKEEKVPGGKTDVNVVVEKNGKALGSKEATDLLKKKDLGEKLGKDGDYEVDGFGKAYPGNGKSTSEGDNSTIIIIIVVVSLAVISVAIVAVVLLRKRKEEENKQSMVMQQRVAMSHGGVSTSDLIPRETTKTNAAYDGGDEVNGDGTFMFEMPGNLKTTKIDSAAEP